MAEKQEGLRIWVATEVERLARMLIQEERHELTSYPNVQVVYLFRNKEQKLSGKSCRATASVKRGTDLVLAQIFAKNFERDGVTPKEMQGGGYFVIQVLHDVWQSYGDHERRALLHHELKHCGIDEDDDGKIKLTIRPHDFERFASEVQKYGFWDEELTWMASAFKERFRAYLAEHEDQEEALLRRVRDQQG